MQYETMKDSKWLPLNCKNCLTATEPDNLFSGYCLNCVKQATQITENVKHLKDAIREKWEQFSKIKN